MVGWVAYAVGGTLMLISLPSRALVEDFFGEPFRMYFAVVAVAEVMFTAGGMFSTGLGARELFKEVIPLIGFLGSYAFMIPGVFFIWLASRNGLGLWIGRVFLTLILLLGPGWLCGLYLVELREDLELFELGLGFWLWFVSVPMMAAAFWIVRPPKEAELAVMPVERTETGVADD